MTGGRFLVPPSTTIAVNMQSIFVGICGILEALPTFTRPTNSPTWHAGSCRKVCWRYRNLGPHQVHLDRTEIVRVRPCLMVNKRLWMWPGDSSTDCDSFIPGAEALRLPIKTYSHLVCLSFPAINSPCKLMLVKSAPGRSAAGQMI